MDLQPALQQIREGKVRVLGVTAPKRVAVAPDIPTIAEGGLSGFELVAWQGVVAPAGTPRPIIDRLADQIEKLKADPATRGHFGDRRGWRVAISSIREVQRQAQREQPNGTPVFMLGHSMGSYLLQHYVADSGAGLGGAIFSATSGDLGTLRPIGLGLIRLERTLYGVRHPSAIGEALSFRNFNKPFKPARTPFDWL